MKLTVCNSGQSDMLHYTGLTYRVSATQLFVWCTKVAHTSQQCVAKYRFNMSPKGSFMLNINMDTDGAFCTYSAFILSVFLHVF